MKRLFTALLCMMFCATGYSQAVVSGEYYFDNDPGIGNGTALTFTPGDSITLNTSISTSGLTEGFHRLYTRFKNSNSAWSLSEGRSFLLQDLTPLDNSIISAEYIFDNDPGVGNGNAIAVAAADSISLLTAIPVSGLVEGVHRLFTRFKTASGRWSLFESRTFYVQPIPVNPNIVAAEYFFDTDPGFGNATSINIGTAADSVQIIADIPVPALTAGVHILYIRAQNADGKWSLYEPRQFNVCATYGAVSTYEVNVSGHKAVFTNLSTDNNSNTWTFGDGTPDVNQYNPSHDYATGGNYNACLITSNACGADTFCANVPVRGIQHVTPSHSGNHGAVLMHVYGANFSADDIITLSGSGLPELTADNVSFISSSHLFARFIFNNEPLGLYNVVVANGTSADTLMNGFTVEAAQPQAAFLEINGHYKRLPLMYNPVSIKVGNNGNTVMYGVPLLVTIHPADRFLVAGTAFDNLNLPDSLSQLLPPARFYKTYDIAIADSVLTGYFLLPYVAPGSPRYFDLRISSPSLTDYTVTATVGSSWLDSTALAELEMRSSCIFNPPCANCLMDLLGFVPGPVGCGAGIANVPCSIHAAVDSLTASTAIDIPASIAGAVLGCLNQPMWASESRQIAQGVTSMAAGAQGAYGSCAGAGGCGGDLATRGVSFHTVTSLDPNEKAANIGTTPENYINVNTPLDYNIKFENVDTATNPALTVIVRDTLDASNYDFSTFAFTSIVLGDSLYKIEPELDSFAVDIDLNPTLDINLRVVGKFDASTGVATLTYSSFDPLTMALTDDISLGFLPPNITSPEGEGAINFSVRPLTSLPNLTVVPNIASIYFDNNAPVHTPLWINTVDKGLPSSQVQPLSASSADTLIDIQITGSDAESGVASYDIYVSTNDGPYALWRHRVRVSQLTFDGEYGNQYEFYSVATDKVDNRELPPTNADDNPDAVTVIITAIEALAQSDATMTVYPNPLSQGCTVQYKLPNASNVTLELNDITGRNHITEELGMQTPGTHQHYLDARSLPQGVFFCKLICSDGVLLKKLTVAH